MIRRLTRNIVRLPARTLAGVQRRLDPVYRLQREADALVPKLLGKDRLALLEKVPGHSSARKCRLLSHLANQSPSGGCWVEIGAFKGKSAAWLVETASKRIDRPTVVSIDPHLRDTWETFQGTVRQFDLQARGLEIRRGFSHDVGKTWNRPISLLWIDGSHEYPDVLHDIEDFVPWVIEGGWIVFDDAAGGKFPGVEQAIAERMTDRSGCENVGVILPFAIFRRVA
jgi:predicted O-methyltransferase YrrM